MQSAANASRALRRGLERLAPVRGTTPADDAAGRPRSLRWRLALWYGALVSAALLLFGALVTVLTANAVMQGVDTELGAEARIVTLGLEHNLVSAAPYWPATLNLDAVDAYRDPGMTVAVLDAQGHARYQSGGSADLAPGGDPAAFAAALSGSTRLLTTRVAGEQVRLIVTPVRAPAVANAPPTPPSSGPDLRPPGTTAPHTTTTLAPEQQPPVIGALVVAKSLRDVNETLLMLRTVLLLTGLAILAGALLGGWAIARRVLRPLALIDATARQIAAGTATGATAGPLRHRVPRPPSDDELAHLVDTLNGMLAALEHATQVQRRFVADASHELRAPLTTIQGNLAFLQRHANELPVEERQSMLSDAHGETLRLARLVDDLLLLARADASSDETANGSPLRVAAGQPRAIGPAAAERNGNSPDRAGPIELDRVVLQLVRQLRGRLAADASHLRIDLGRVEPIRVRGDEETVRRVALILLDNAMKYTPPVGDDETAGRITVAIERAGADAVLRVQDTGIGIEPADLPHLFERFFRADRARKREGTGLGLAIAHTLVDRLGGRITVESTPGRGSTFSVRLPAADADPFTYGK